MNTDNIKILKNLEKAANMLPLPDINVRDGVWEQIELENNVIEIDSFRYIAVACAAVAIIALFLSTDILTSIQSNVAWEVYDQAMNIF